MAEYIERESLAKDGWYLQRHINGDGHACVESMNILDVPAADVRPVVHGQWKRPKTINGRVKCFICSACGIGQVFRTSICPNCGARMDLT